MKKSIQVFVAFLFIGTALSCGTSKNTFFHREYHALTTHYNVLFNGKEALKVGETILNEIYEDNFFEILPVEPFH